MNKKIPIGFTVALVFLAAAIAFFCGSQITKSKINSALVDLNEKQAQFAKLAELDNCIRMNYDGKIDEAALMDAICRGYAAAADGERIIYVNAAELAQSEYAESSGAYTIYKLSDGSAIVIKAASEAQTDPTNPSESQATVPTDKTDGTQTSQAEQ